MDAPPPPSASSEVSILLVDDEARNLDVLESVLASPDCRLVRALSAERALGLLLDGEFAAIVLDIQMPDMNGIELANLVKQRKRTQHIPIIFLTAYFQEDKDVLEGYGMGAVDYLTKPINPQILKSKIGVFVELFRKTRALAATNAALELEVAHRLKAEQALQQANNELEARVQARTTDLIRANEELRDRERALRVSEAQAMAASRAKDDFLAKLSHELRTPLNPVLLIATEAAGNSQLPPAVREDFSIIAKNVALEARLIDDMLDLTRIARGKLALEMRPIDVHGALQEAFAMVRDEIDEKRIVPRLDLTAPSSIVLGDDVRLKQVFWNVIKNAAKFTPPGGEVRIATSSTPHELTVAVADTGIGITPAELARVFAAFTQGDHAETDAHRFGGVGLGLAIARTIVELHSGSIHATSAGRDLGTTFLIRLPLDPAARPATPLPVAAPGQVKSGGSSSPHPARRILLVEDHKPTALALMHLLSRRHHAVVLASCLAEARDLSARERFDILISDIGLPDGDGCDLMRDLRHQPGLVGVALTGYGMEQDVERSHASGFIAHLTKPVSIASLEEALATAGHRLDESGRRQP